VSLSPKADKSFGQHFLVNAGVVEKIVNSVERLAQSANAHVVEVGPGPGALTGPLLKKGFRVTALEIDARMREHLHEKFSQEVAAGQLKIIDCDAAEFDWMRWESEQKKSEKAHVVCGNLPYNVGTQILFRCLEFSQDLNAFCFMLQKEVVQRLVAPEGSKDYGLPGVSLGLLVDVRDTFWVSPGSFNPPPKVQSGVISYARKPVLDARLDPRTMDTQYFAFNKAIRKAFQNRRKMLRKTFPLLEPTEWGTMRAENVSPQDWWRLWQEGSLQ
jgi:16S rRNA (adenine1518-N6/adenine1519-N6)-dimethyltransferase